MIQLHAPTALPSPVTIVQEAGWAPGPVWKVAENLAPTGVRSPDRPARSESLYRLSYRGPHVLIVSLSYFEEEEIMIRSRMKDARRLT